MARRGRLQRRAGASIGLYIYIGIGLAACAAASASEPVERTIASDRRFDVLTAPASDDDRRALLARAGAELGSWSIQLAGAEIDGARLAEIAAGSPDEPLLRAIREELRLPIDLDDFILFLDDVLREGRAGRRGERVWLTPGRARAAGILVHPDDVFRVGAPRRYGEKATLSIEMPRPQLELPRPEDGAALGPGWAMRYPNPQEEQGRLHALAVAPGAKGFAQRIDSLLRQLRSQGADVHLSSTLRRRERGYLMWGAFVLSRASGEGELSRWLRRLEAANREWRLNVPIAWRHPAGWQATRQAAREMADTYEVVYATEAGARDSNHYAGRAVDLVAVGLPRRLRLRAMDGAEQEFDLSGIDEPRDLSLTPQLIDWIEARFDLEKLRSDHPHWDDAEARSDREAEPKRPAPPGSTPSS